jgi:hypothetical protein
MQRLFLLEIETRATSADAVRRNWLVLDIRHSRLKKMFRFALANLCGLVFGALTVLSMLPLSFPDKRAALLGAFFNRFAIGFVVILIDIPCSGWLIGLTIGILLSLPPAIITKAFAPILGIGAVGGVIIGLIRAKFAV